MIQGKFPEERDLEAELFGDLPPPRPRNPLAKESLYQTVVTGGVVEHDNDSKGRPRCGAPVVSNRRLGHVRGPIAQCVVCFKEGP